MSVTRPVAVEYIPPKPGLLAVGHMLRGTVGGCLDGEELEEGLCEFVRSTGEWRNENVGSRGFTGMGDILVPWKMEKMALV